MHKILSREEIIVMLEKRDGPDCFLCKDPFDKDEEKTLDHWYPMSWCRMNGWTEDKIWNVKNLRLAHKSCNAKKSNLVPIDDVTVPMRKHDPFRSRAVKRSERPDFCDTCASGRLLLIDEICPDCGSGPQPAVAPRAYQKSPKECTHSGHDHCWMCFIGFVEREPAIITVLDGEFLD